MCPYGNLNPNGNNNNIIFSMTIRAYINVSRVIFIDEPNIYRMENI